MSEWAVVGVIIALVGLIATVVSPIVRLNTTITKLNTIVERVEGSLEDLADKNSKGHARIWEHNEEQDKKLNDHETRITVIEGRGE